MGADWGGENPKLGPTLYALSEERESLVRQKSRFHGADSWLETATGLV